jgi:hypothetical protein
MRRRDPLKTGRAVGAVIPEANAQPAAQTLRNAMATSSSA